MKWKMYVMDAQLRLQTHQQEHYQWFVTNAVFLNVSGYSVIDYNNALYLL